MNDMVRVIVSIIIGAVITFALFVFMASLVGGQVKRTKVSEESPVIQLTMEQQDTSVQKKTRVVPPPPTPPEQPVKLQTVPDDTAAEIDTSMSFNMEMVDIGHTNTNFELGSLLTRDGDATPIVRIEPQYPIAAARNGKEGWVQLRFTISESGSVENVTIIKSEPRRVFDREAKRALRKWKYKPKIVDGKPVRQTDMTVQLDFRLNQG